ncbi:MAG: energy transducer TonB [Bacteroidales bacterium]|nr:energy transducer TonB [Bacteroidales bacterium]
MKKYIFAILMACITFAGFAQDKKELMEVKSTVASGFDKCAMYPGGEKALNTFIHKNVDYPMAAIKSGKEGDVTVRFTVNTDGTVSNVKVVKSLEPNLDAEAVKVVSKMKGWTPAMKDGKAVPMDYQVNCNFTK